MIVMVMLVIAIVGVMMILVVLAIMLVIAGMMSKIEAMARKIVEVITKKGRRKEREASNLYLTAFSESMTHNSTKKYFKSEAQRLRDNTYGLRLQKRVLFFFFFLFLLFLSFLPLFYHLILQPLFNFPQSCSVYIVHFSFLSSCPTFYSKLHNSFYINLSNLALLCCKVERNKRHRRTASYYNNLNKSSLHS